MKLLALITDGFGGAGGIAGYNRHLLTALAANGDGAEIVVLPRYGRTEATAPAPIRQYAPRRGKLLYTITALWLGASGRRRFDVVLCGHLHLAPLAVIVAWMCRAPLWLQLHGWEAWQPLAGLQSWAARRAIMITAVSRHTRHRFLQHGRVDPSRIRILPNTMEEHIQPGPKPDYLIERHRLRDRKVLLTVGRLDAAERRKGHRQVIRALPEIIRNCGPMTYLIVGEGDDRPHLEEAARLAGVQDEVRFVGQVPDDQLPDYYRVADVFVMPSTQEGFGIVFIEAAAAGLTPIGGNADGSVDALADGAIGLVVDAESPERLVEAVAAIIAGGGPDPAAVGRYRFENFARHANGLVRTHLCPDASPATLAVTGSRAPSMRLVIEPHMMAMNYWRDLWRYRELLYFLAWRDVTVRYKQMTIGILWALLRPALTMLVFVAFRRLVRLPSGEVPDPVLVLAAVLPWQFFSSALAEASGSLIANSNLVSKVYFPRLVIPCAAILTSLVDFLITLAMMALVMVWYGVVPGWQIVALPFFVLLSFGLSLGLGLLLAALNVQYRDFRYVVPFIIQFGLFVSPVAFSTAEVPQQWLIFYALNPLVGIIDGFRWSLLGGASPIIPGTIILAAAMTLLMLLLGVWYFRRMEHGFADVI